MPMPTATASALLAAAIPWPCALWLPRALLGVGLEEAVDRALPMAVGAIVLLLLLLQVLRPTDDVLSSHRDDTALPPRARTTLGARLRRALTGLAVGTVVCHVVIVLFGAPVEHLVLRTLLLAALLATLSVVPAFVHCGHWRETLDHLVHARHRTAAELLVTSASLGGALGAYCGAFPIPLDWDRPWQQWPLTCVYGSLGGFSLGTLGAVVASSIVFRGGRHPRERKTQ